MLAVIALSGCFKSHYVTRRKLTGTCSGACNYYLTCKGSNDQVLYQACLSECGQVFSDAVSLAAFESLYCADLIAYIEGPSGREPGQPLPAPPRSPSASP